MNIDVRISKYDKFILAVKSNDTIYILGSAYRDNIDIMLNNHIRTNKRISYIIVERPTNNYEIITRLLRAFLED